MSENNHIETLIIRYLEQNISEEDIRELDRWLAESADHKWYFFQLKSIYERICKDKHFSEKEQEKSWERMLNKLEAKSSINNSNTSKKNGLPIRILKYAAIITVTMVMGWGFGEINKNRPHHPKENPVSWNEIKMQKGGKPGTIFLSDGSKVSLNAATTFKYPTNFSDKEREVYLNGEAYFEIKEDTDKPFIVKLNNQHITVLGTSFNIESYSEEDYSIVTLLSGSISLETFNNKHEPISSQVMKPNQRAYYDKKTGIVSLENIDASLSECMDKRRI